MITVSLETRTTSAGRKRYYFICYDKTRSPKRKSIAAGTTHKSVATKRKRALEAQIENGDFDPWEGPKDVVTIVKAARNYVEDCEARGLRPKTVYIYKSVTRQFVEHVKADTPIDQVTVKQIRSFCNMKHLSAASRRHRYRQVRVFLNYCVRAGLLETNPALEARIPKAKKVAKKLITPADFERILTAIEIDLAEPSPYQRRAGHWLAPMIKTAYYCGLRRGEAIRLRWDDIDLEQNEITIRASKSHDRIIPIASPLREVLIDWMTTSGGHGLVFCKEGGGGFSDGYISRTFNRYAKMAGVKVTAFHGLRHGTATALLAMNVNTRVVQEIMGHSSITITEQYQHVNMSMLRAEMEKAFSTGRRTWSSEFIDPNRISADRQDE